MAPHWKMALVTGSTWALIYWACQMHALTDPLVLLGLYAWFGGGLFLMVKSIKSASGSAKNGPLYRWWQTAPIGAALSWLRPAVAGVFNLRKRFPAKVARVELALGQTRLEIAEARSMCQALTTSGHDSGTSEQLRSIDSTLAKILHALETDPRKLSTIATLNADYLVPIKKCLSLYKTLLGRDLTSAREVIQETEQDTLPFLAAKLYCLYEQLHAAEIAQLSVMKSEIELARNVEVAIPAEAEALAVGH